MIRLCQTVQCAKHAAARWRNAVPAQHAKFARRKIPMIAFAAAHGPAGYPRRHPFADTSPSRPAQLVASTCGTVMTSDHGGIC